MSYNVLCDRCGFKHKDHELQEDWQHFMVCQPCFETRHPQDMIRAIPDQKPLPYVRPDNNGIDGGIALNPLTQTDIPEGTFTLNNSTITDSDVVATPCDDTTNTLTAADYDGTTFHLRGYGNGSGAPLFGSITPTTFLGHTIGALYTSTLGPTVFNLQGSYAATLFTCLRIDDTTYLAEDANFFELGGFSIWSWASTNAIPAVGTYDVGIG